MTPEPRRNDDAERRAQEFRTLFEIGLALNQTLNLHELADVVYKRVCALLPADVFFLARYDAAEQRIHFDKWVEHGQELDQFSYARAERRGLTWWIIEYKQPLLIGDLLEEQGLPVAAVPRGAPVRSWLGVPLIAANGLVGVLSVQNYLPNQFNGEDLRLLTAIAGPVAVAFENAILFDQMKARTRELATANEIARVLGSTLRLKDVLQSFFVQVMSLFAAEGGSLLLYDQDTSELVFEVVRGGAGQALVKTRIPSTKGIAGSVLGRGQALAVPDVHTDPRWSQTVDEYTGFETRSLLAAPLKSQDRVIGVIELVNRTDGRPFTASHATLLETFSASAAVAIENARLHEKTERTLAEISTLYIELQEQDRLKTELVQNLSHELRTPLTFIKGYVEILLSGGMDTLSPEQTESLGIVKDKTDAVIRLVNDIFTLQWNQSRMQFESQSLGDIVLHAIQGASVAAEAAGVRLVSDVPPELPTVRGDRDRLMQVMDNLLGNAIKFSPNGGEVRVRVVEGEHDLLVQVTDQGVGIPRDKLDKIFERFFQVDGSATRRFGGMGLGLAIVRQILREHGGQIWADSEPDHGSTFSFTLPKDKA